MHERGGPLTPYSPQCEGPDFPVKHWEVGALLVTQEPVLGTFHFNHDKVQALSDRIMIVIDKSACWSRVRAALVCPSIH